MSDPLHPYIIFLPVKRKQKVLRRIFGSKVPIDILKFSITKGIDNKIYQKDMLKTFSYSNKTLIAHLKELTNSGILEEGMDKIESGNRTVWVKYFTLSDIGKWFALLLKSEKTLSKDEKTDLICNIFGYYIRLMKKLSERFQINKEILQEIFKKEME